MVSILRHRLMSAAAGARPSIVVTMAVVALTALLLAALPRPLSPDISGQLWLADRLRHGARLYIDISEINPPLWFWLAIPVDAVADLLGLRADTVLIGAIGAAVLASLLATNLLLRPYPPAVRTALLLYGAFVLLVMPLRDLGQREQMALIAALPYIALIALRRDGRAVSPWLALAVASGAALGFALKHYFIGVPLLLELWLVLGLRRRWRPVRPETLILAVGAVSYLAAILIVTPGYLQVSVPELLLAYGTTGAPSLSYMIRPAQPIWLLIVCGIIAQRATTRRALSPLAIALLVAAGGFFLAWLIQHKGWPYQSIATTGTLALAIAVMLAEGVLGGAARPRVIALAALVAPILLVVVPTNWVPTPDTDIAAALSDLGAGDAVAIVAKEGRTAWPSTVDRGFRHVGRRGSYWIFAALDANDRGPHDPRIDALGRRIVREAVIDFRCTPPRRIVFTPRSLPTETTASEAPLGFFRRDPQVSGLLEHYRRLARPGNFDAFELIRPLDPPPAALCPRGV